MKILNPILIGASVLLAVLVLTNSLIGQRNVDISKRLSQAQQLLGSANNNKAALRAIATRVNQSAAQDPEMKAVLVRQEINVTPEPAATR